MKHKGREIEVFGELMHQLVRGNVKVTTYPARVTEVDWEAKTATVKGLIDDLEFYDVLLGLGDFKVKPKIGTKCLIGVILNSESYTFLIDAEAVEEYSWSSDNTNVSIRKDGVVIAQSADTLRKVLDDLIVEISKIIVIQGVTPNVTVLTAIKQRLNTILKD